MASTLWRRAMGKGLADGELRGQRKALALLLRERLGSALARPLVARLTECDQQTLNRALKLIAVPRSDKRLLAALEELLRESGTRG